MFKVVSDLYKKSRNILKIEATDKKSFMTI